MKKQVFGMMLTLAIASTASAQRIKLADGDLSALAHEKELNVEYVYDNMKVGKFATEAEYVKKKTDDYNKKESGKGDDWAKAWVADRQSRYEPKFQELFFKGSEITIGGSPKAKYTMIVRTEFTEPGYNVGVMRGNAQINLSVDFVETADRTKKLATVTVEKALGRTFGGYDFDTGLRIAEAYADAGKALGKFVKDKID